MDNIDKKYVSIDLFNCFIEKWCGSNFPHLIDTDENDGQKFREMLYSMEDQLADKDSQIEALKKQLEEKIV